MTNRKDEINKKEEIIRKIHFIVVCNKNDVCLDSELHGEIAELLEEYAQLRYAELNKEKIDGKKEAIAIYLWNMNYGKRLKEVGLSYEALQHAEKQALPELKKQAEVILDLVRYIEEKD